MSAACLLGYIKVKGSFSIVKGQVWACLCKIGDLTRLKTHGLVRLVAWFMSGIISTLQGYFFICGLTRVSEANMWFNF